jgi:hypothetical protein
MPRGGQCVCVRVCMSCVCARAHLPCACVRACLPARVPGMQQHTLLYNYK